MTSQRVSRLVEMVQQLRSGAVERPAVRRLIGVLAVAIFAGFLYAARGSIPTWNEVEWPYLATSAFIVSPVMVLWMGAQYRLSGKLTGHTIHVGEASRIAILSGAANLLPIPGSVIIRAEALRSKGVTFKRSALASALVGVAWLGSSGVLAGILILSENLVVGVVALVLGLAGLGMYAAGVRSLVPPEEVRNLVVLGALQGAGMALTAGLNLFVVTRGLRFDASVASTFLVSTSGVISAAIGIFPGGLGLREAMAAGLSGFTGLTAAEGTLAATTVHLTIVVVLLLAAIAISVRPARDTRSNRGPSDADRSQPESPKS